MLNATESSTSGAAQVIIDLFRNRINRQKTSPADAVRIAAEESRRILDPTTRNSLCVRATSGSALRGNRPSGLGPSLRAAVFLPPCASYPPAAGLLLSPDS